MPSRAVAALAGILTLGLAAAPAGAEPGRAFYGVAPQRLPTSQEIERMGEGRVGTLRFQLRWSAVDPSPAPGQYDWTEVDPIVAAATRNGIRPLPFLFSTPDWVATLLDGRSCAGECFAYAPRSRAALEAWGQFVAAAVDRYGPGGAFWAERPELPARPIRDWQVWNEQNSPPFYRPRPSVEGYADLLMVAGGVIRVYDPGARVVLGGMYASPNRGRPPAFDAFEFLRSLYRIDGVKDSFDVVAAHPYSPKVSGVLAQAREFRRTVRAAGDDTTPLWITEIGWSSAKGDHPYNRGPGGQANRLRDLLGRLERERRSLRLHRVIWFSWRDVTSGLPVCDWCSLSGLFKERALRPKPAWRAFTEFTGGR